MQTEKYTAKIIYLGVVNMQKVKKAQVSGMTSPTSMACAMVFLLLGTAFSADRVVGANSTLDIVPSARSAALGGASMALDEDYLGLVSNPQQLSSIDYSWVSFSHTEYYEDTKYDFSSVAIPLGEGQGLGVSFARYGADDIPYIKEGEPLPEGSNYNTLSMADWVFSLSFGKKIMDRLELGVSFHGLYREMDQTGYGFRGDAGVRYRIVDQFYLSGFLKGWTSSATTWDSGEFEYSSPEFYPAASYNVAVRYLYGKLGLYWQGAGLIHQESRELEYDVGDGGRIWESPLDWLKGGRGGVEFAFDFGLSLRAGLNSFTTYKSVTAGAGLCIARFVNVDYAFESHPVLSPIHRVSVSVSPYLFAHSPKQKERNMKVVPKSVLTEQTEEDVDIIEPEEVKDESRKGLQTNLQSDGPSATDSQSPPAPSRGVIVETEDEVLE